MLGVMILKKYIFVMLRRLAFYCINVKGNKEIGWFGLPPSSFYAVLFSSFNHIWVQRKDLNTFCFGPELTMIWQYLMFFRLSVFSN
jgi:hypothetical protein